MAVAACAQWKPRGGAQYRSAPGALRSEDAATPAGKQAEKSLADLASDAGVSRRTMAQASKVAKTAAPEVASAVTPF